MVDVVLGSSAPPNRRLFMNPRPVEVRLCNWAVHYLYYILKPKGLGYQLRVIVMAFRLIETSTRELKTIVGMPIPEYAILSHTWVAGEEVSHQEMKDIQLQPEHPATQ